MNEPIINPIVFYLIDLAGDLEAFVCVALIAIIAIFAILYFCFSDEINDFTKKVIKPTIITIVILALVAIAIPSDKTMYAMLVSNYVTQENVEKAEDKVKEITDYIFDKVEETKGD